MTTATCSYFVVEQFEAVPGAHRGSVRCWLAREGRMWLIVSCLKWLARSGRPTLRGALAAD